jgi:hypothetical protein
MVKIEAKVTLEKPHEDATEAPETSSEHKTGAGTGRRTNHE